MTNGLENFQGSTYKTRERAVAAFLKKYDLNPGFSRFIASNMDGRFFPVCVGKKPF